MCKEGVLSEIRHAAHLADFPQMLSTAGRGRGAQRLACILVRRHLRGYRRVLPMGRSGSHEEREVGRARREQAKWSREVRLFKVCVEVTMGHWVWGLKMQNPMWQHCSEMPRVDPGFKNIWTTPLTLWLNMYCVAHFTSFGAPILQRFTHTLHCK